MLNTKLPDKIKGLDAGNMLINSLSDSAKENEHLLSIYDNEIKPELKKIITQHSILGAVCGPLPTMGIATTTNLIIAYTRLSNTLDIPIMQEFDKLLKPIFSSIKWAFVKATMFLAVFKVFITGLDLTGIGILAGIVCGAPVGYYFSNKACNMYTHEIGKFIDELR